HMDVPSQYRRVEEVIKSTGEEHAIDGKTPSSPSTVNETPAITKTEERCEQRTDKSSMGGGVKTTPIDEIGGTINSSRQISSGQNTRAKISSGEQIGAVRGVGVQKEAAAGKKFDPLTKKIASPAMKEGAGPGMLDIIREDGHNPTGPKLFHGDVSDGHGEEGTNERWNAAGH
ncbi:hypothetical protein Ancab_004584, partial [Ancistrocladus abbreviatus]